MPVESVTNAFSTPPADQISSRAAAMDRADFLQMLTAQLRAQDPLNPLSGQDFASQLAQFSSLQELQGIGGTLDQSLQANVLLAQTFNNTMAASLIGKMVKADVNEVQIGSAGNTSLHYQLQDPATEITIEIRDADGTVMRTLTVPAQVAGDHTVEWDGLNGDGEHVPEGSYTFAVTATDADGTTVPVTTFLEGRVTEIRYVDGGVRLYIGDTEILLGQVMSISDPSDTRKG